MSLGAGLQIGRSGILSSQAALEVVGNNLANVATRGYHRQAVTLTPIGNQQIQQGVFVGRGVQLSAITRQIDAALESRLRGAISEESGAAVRQNLLSQIEAIENEFSEIGLSSRLGAFFNSWSNLANNPTDLSLRTLVIQEATTLAGTLDRMHAELLQQRELVESSAKASVVRVNDLLGQIESLNQQIVVQGGGSGGPSGLLDQRDLLLGELASYLDISTVQGSSGQVDIFVGSTPIMLNGKSWGVELDTATVDGESVLQLRVAKDGTPLKSAAGSLGAMMAFREGDWKDAFNAVNDLANQLIWQVNRVHSQGQGTELFSQVTGTARVEDINAALNSPQAGLAFVAGHGSFQIHVTQKSTGERITHNINIDLDGINVGSDTSLSSLIASINAVGNISAGVTSDGRLTIASDSGDFSFSFSNDTSGVLAALGVNTFFTGSHAGDIGVNQRLIGSPALLAAGQGHEPGDNSIALAVAGLRDKPLGEAGGFSLTQMWNRHVEDFAARLGRAREQAEAAGVVRQNLEARQQSVSGVNVDEETIDLMRYQRAYQASARFLSVVDELMQTLLGVI